MQVKVEEHWIEDPKRSREAREHLYSLVRFLALRRLLREEESAPPSRTPGE